MKIIDADMLKTRFEPKQAYFTEAIVRKIDTEIAIQEPQWIPCSERLPSESDYYLVTIINPFGEKEVCVIWFAYKADYGVSEWREITDGDTVFAWMPLPEPWKGEQNERF